MITVLILGAFSSAANVSAAPGGNGNDDNKDNKGKSAEAKENQENKGKSSEAKDKNVSSSNDDNKENKGKSSENKGKNVSSSSDDNKENKGKSSEAKDKNVNSSDNKGKGKSSEAKANKGKSQNSNQGNSNKITICHIPPGNIGNAHTITVGWSALPAHLGHGDYEGPCEDENSGGGGNNRPTLTVNKVLIPSDDTGVFNLRIDTVTEGTGANVGNGGTTGSITVTPGQHTVDETAGTATDLANYNSVIGGDCATDGTVTLVAGDNKVCTITNTPLTQISTTEDIPKNIRSFHLKSKG